MNTVPLPPSGLVIALQYFSGDLSQAMRLARLVADIEKFPRRDVTFALVRRFDMEDLSAEEHETANYVRATFPVLIFRAKREGTGHPNGPNALSSGAMDHLARMWRTGSLHRRAAFLIEADGCPLRTDWLDCIAEAHQWTVMEGKAITGAAMSDVRHVNGSMAIQFPWWIDHPSVHETPAGSAWDIHHADTIMAAARPTTRIANHHGARGWTSEQLIPMSREISWLASTKDDSAIAWVEKALVNR